MDSRFRGNDTAKEGRHPRESGDPDCFSLYAMHFYLNFEFLQAFPIIFVDR